MDDADRELIGRRRRDVNRLGFAVQLATLRMLGMFLPDPLDVPWPLVVFLADQLGIGDGSVVNGYTERSKTAYEHQWQIVDSYGYAAWDTETMSAVRAFVAARAWASPEGPTRLFERAAGWLRERKVLLPGVSVLARLVSEVRVEQAERLYGELVAAVPVATAARLEALLTVGAGARVSDLERLRSGPRQVAVSEVVRQLERLTVLRDFGLSAIELPTLSAGRV